MRSIWLRRVAIVDTCLVSTADICLVSPADICPVPTADICPVSTDDTWLLWGHLGTDENDFDPFFTYNTQNGTQPVEPMEPVEPVEPRKRGHGPLRRASDPAPGVRNTRWELSKSSSRTSKTDPEAVVG